MYIQKTKKKKKQRKLFLKIKLQTLYRFAEKAGLILNIKKTQSLI